MCSALPEGRLERCRRGCCGALRGSRLRRAGQPETVPGQGLTCRRVGGAPVTVTGADGITLSSVSRSFRLIGLLFRERGLEKSAPRGICPASSDRLSRTECQNPRSELGERLWDKGQRSQRSRRPHTHSPESAPTVSPRSGEDTAGLLSAAVLRTGFPARQEPRPGLVTGRQQCQPSRECRGLAVSPSPWKIRRELSETPAWSSHKPAAPLPLASQERGLVWGGSARLCRQE